MSTGAEIKLPAPTETRLVTIVAHVDHGKTSLADNLITANGIINEKLSGSVRYLDSTEEEQRRGITMHASAIGLRHDYKDKLMVVHLIDSPGHVDFCQEVTSSLMACDGALVVIDAVEGLGARSHAVLRESYSNELVPILVINKIDRLCTELHLSKVEAYIRLRVLLESVNAACASMINAYASETEEIIDGVTKDFISSEEYHELWNFDPIKGNVIFASALHNWAFSVPSLSRSLFKSGILPIKPLLSRKFLFGDYKYNLEKKKVFAWKSQNEDESVLPMFVEYGLAPIWDIYHGIIEYAESLNILQHSGVESTKTIRKVKITDATPGIAAIMSALKCGPLSTPGYKIDNLEDLQKTFNSNNISKSFEGLQRAILRRFRTLSDVVMDTVCELFPDPILATRKKSLGLQLSLESSLLSISQRESYSMVENAIQSCTPSKATMTIAHVCKFVAVARRDLGDHGNRLNDIEADSPTVLLGLTRVISGVLQSCDVEYHLFGSTVKSSDRSHDNSTIPKRRIQLFLIMGSSYVAVKEVPAGHICAVSNLDDLRWRTLTICDREFGIPIHGITLKAKPLVKVNVSTIVPSDTDILERGLVKLSLADASVDTTVTKRGELLLASLGELHLENSLRDLLHIYCDKPIEIRTSDPIIEFGEGTVYFDFEEKGIEGLRKAWNTLPSLRQVTISPYCDEDGIENAKLGRCRSVLGGKHVAVSVRVVPLSVNIFQCLKQINDGKVIEKNLMMDSTEDVLRLGRVLGISTDKIDIESKSSEILEVLASLSKVIDELGDNVLIEAPDVANGSNIYPIIGDMVYSQRSNEDDDLDDIREEEKPNSPYMVYQSIINRIFGEGENESANFSDNESKLEVINIWKNRMIGSAIAGFHAAMRAGPLCEEPIRNILVIVEAVEIALIQKEQSQISPSYITPKPIGGGIILSAFRQAIRCALLTRPVRLVEGYFKLSLHSSLEGLGPLYNILSKRRGRVEKDTMVDGTDLLLIEALIPQAEAFGLTQELLLKSSGNVTAPEMIFSHYELLDEDPFWIPSSLEEREDYGEILTSGDSSTGVAKHRALAYLRKTRRRKGLAIDEEKILKDGEKQRTLARKK